MRIVVTGNIGCGKSTVCEMLARHLPRFELVSVDQMVSRLYENPEFQRELEWLCGTRSKPEVSRVVFADAGLKQKVEALSLKFLTNELDRVFQRSNVIVEFPLFYEIPRWVPHADFVLVLGCDAETQRNRVLARDGISTEHFEQVLASQHSTSVKQLMGSAYLDTSCALSELDAHIVGILQKIKGDMLERRCARLFESTTIWEPLKRAYSEEHRKYHVLQHLVELFEVMDGYAEEPGQNARELAVWMHDLVYATDERYTHNESQSVSRMWELIRAHCSDAWIQLHMSDVLLAAEITLATKTHSICSPYLSGNKSAKRACELFLDADLAILVQDLDRFLEFDRQIAEEWGQDANAPSAEFREGRANALEHLSQRDSLYFTEYFGSQAEEGLRRLATLVKAYRQVP
jgi:dephospho-CoA kinase/predicted metal-dependent HD superfamily phosphohydrolase